LYTQIKKKRHSLNEGASLTLYKKKKKKKKIIKKKKKKKKKRRSSKRIRIWIFIFALSLLSLVYFTLLHELS
jgi:uncharacterized membrane protein